MKPEQPCGRRTALEITPAAATGVASLKRIKALEFATSRTTVKDFARQVAEAPLFNPIGTSILSSRSIVISKHGGLK